MEVDIQSLLNPIFFGLGLYREITQEISRIIPSYIYISANTRSLTDYFDLLNPRELRR